MNKTSPRYTEEFKRDAVRLVEMSDKLKTKIARELGIGDSALYRWLKEYGQLQSQARMVRGPQRERSGGREPTAAAGSGGAAAGAGYFKKGYQHLQPGARVSYQLIADHQGEYAVERMCGALGVSVSGYYAWHNRGPSAREQSDEELLTHIRVIHQDSRGLYGSPRIHAALQQAGVRCSRKRVERLMRAADIHSLRRVRRRVRTTDSDHHRPVAPNVLQRDFRASAPNQKWVGDILGVPTDEGWLYVAALLVTFSRRIIGLAMSAYRDEPLVMAAVRMALAHRVLVGDLIHHTDRSNQYTADDYLALLKAHGVTVSMSGKGDPYNNVMMESFFSTLRAECTERHHFTSGSQTYSGCHTVCSLPGLTVVMRKPSHDEAKGKTV